MRVPSFYLDATLGASFNLPTPDHSRPGKASDLIKRFQQAVDSNREAPLQVVSSFASPARPRTSSTGTSGNAAVAGSPTTSPAASRVAQPRSPDPETFAESTAPFRSAGLNEAPSTSPIGRQQDHRNAQEAFPDMQPAPTQAQADALAADPESQPKAKSPCGSHSPTIAVQQPSVDVPAAEAVPGSTNDIAPRSPSPISIESAAEPAQLDDKLPSSASMSPSIPLSPKSSFSTSGKGKEGLSRPVSPLADSGNLRACPVQDDDSPPPSRRESSERGVPSPPRSEPETQVDDGKPRFARAEPSSSRASSPARMTSKKLLIPNQSKPSSTSTRTKKPNSLNTSIAPSPPPPTSTLNTPRRSVSTSPTSSLKKRTDSVSPTQPRNPSTVSRPKDTSLPSSPSTTRTASSRPPRALTTPTASSLAKARTKVSSPSSPSQSPNPNQQTSPTRFRPNPGTPRLSPTSTRMSPTNSRSGLTNSTRGAAEGRGGSRTAEEITRSGSAAGSSASSASALKGTGFEQPQAKVGDNAGDEGEGGGLSTVSRKMATRGRVGLAGAEAKFGEEEGHKDGEDTEAPKSSGGTSEVGAPGTNSSENEIEQGRGEPEEAATEPRDIDSIPVFKGFGSDRPHGRIPIPMKRIVDPETGVEKMVAVQPQ